MPVARDGSGRRAPDHDADQRGRLDQRDQNDQRALPERPHQPDWPDRLQPDRSASGSVADLRRRLERLPPGHPSSPVDGDGSQRPPPRPRYLEVSLPDDPDSTTDSGRLSSRGDATDEPDGGASLCNAETWQDDVLRFRAMWDDIKVRWPREENASPDRTGDEPGSWRGDSGRALSASQNRRVDAWCDDIGSCEQRITPRLEEVERASSGHLAGKEYRIKGRDRLKDKAATSLEGAPGSGVDRLLANVPDAVRFTLQYDEHGYSAGVSSDIGCMKAQGFELVKLRNYWDSSEYKGINSQWRDTETGQRFELQFHSRISLEAKQLTHNAYERLRAGRVSDIEAGQLSFFQQQVSARIPVPAGACDILDLPR